MDIVIEFPDLEDLYREALTLEPDGNEYMFNQQKTKDDVYFRGLSLEDIDKYKYGYTPGVEKLEELDSYFVLGSSRFKYKWNEEDGDEMSMERAYEGLPYLKQRKRSVGNGTGKFITIHVNTGELAFVSYEQMLKKAYTAASMVNKLETMGYRTQVLLHTLTRNVGFYRGEAVKTLEVKCPIKKFDDPLNIALILYCISPWFHRYWMFLIRASKLKCSSGMGASTTHRKKDSMTDIYIDTGECLTDGGVEEKMSSLSKMMSKNLDNG